jgi:hypothetical protein
MMEKKRKKLAPKKIGVLVGIILLIGAFVIVNSVVLESPLTGFAFLDFDSEEDPYEKFNRVTLEALYAKEYCNDGRHEDKEIRMGEDCIETLYPYIKHSEEIYGIDQLVLSATVEKVIREEMPETAGREISFVFVDSNRVLINTIGLRDGALTG